MRLFGQILFSTDSADVFGGWFTRCAGHHVWVITRIVWRGGHRYQFLECALCGEPRLRIG